MDVIILDGNQRPALAMTRSLGRRGISVFIGEESSPSLASCSRYCRGPFSYRSPFKDSSGFIDDIANRFEPHGDKILIPVTDVTLSEVLARRDRPGLQFIVPFEAYEKYEGVSNKIHLFELARRLEIPMPATEIGIQPLDEDHLLSTVNNMGFPVVLKPVSSRIRTGDGWIAAGVRYARDERDLMARLAEEPFRSHPFLIQERIEGAGIGIFLLMKEGDVLARFAHRRIREKPPSGGVSVLCESIRPPESALESAVRLLRELAWSGIAMVEFKWDRLDDKPKLMEVNARPWGSLQLSISAGVDFPYLLYRFALGDPVRGPEEYKVGMKTRWELGDLDHLLIRAKRNSDALFLPPDAPSRSSVFGNFFMDFFRSSVENEVFRTDDPRPFFFEMARYAEHVLGRSRI
jgi:predicted ATP-grasp superfamily ATP-dependent carboligase